MLREMARVYRLEALALAMRQELLLLTAGGAAEWLALEGLRRQRKAMAEVLEQADAELYGRAVTE